MDVKMYFWEFWEIFFGNFGKFFWEITNRMYYLENRDNRVYFRTYEVDERGYSLTRHPHNYGYFMEDEVKNMVVGKYQEEIGKMNEWVDEQREYLNSLPLETKAGLLLYKKYPHIFRDGFKPLELLESTNSDLRQLFESLPSSDQILRYRLLIGQALKFAPSIPWDIVCYSKIRNDEPFLLIRVDEGKNEFKIDKRQRIIYLDAILECQNEFILMEEREVEIVEAIDDEKLLYINARKETLEEIGLDIQNLTTFRAVIDFPLYQQKEFNILDPFNAYMIVPKAHGLVGSGSLIFCREDNTLLLFQRSYRGDFGGTWAGAGGAIGESRTIVYKTHFIFRTYIYEITLLQKKIWQGLDLPRLNYEHTSFGWFPLDSIWSQLHDFSNPQSLTIPEAVTIFLRTYESQIPIQISSLADRQTIIHKKKYPLYIFNPTSHLYELILPGTAYTLWHFYHTILHLTSSTP